MHFLSVPRELLLLQISSHGSNPRADWELVQLIDRFVALAQLTLRGTLDCFVSLLLRLRCFLFVIRSGVPRFNELVGRLLNVSVILFVIRSLCSAYTLGPVK